MEQLKKFFPDLSSEEIASLNTFQKEFSQWNDKINCISRKDVPHLETRHILHSLAIQKYFPFPKGSKILDIGTGGGFPGIPLAILNPNCQFVLVDSIGKKIKVVNDLIEKLNLSNVEAYPKRVEDIKGDFDFIVSRAVARTKKLMDWVNQNRNLTLNPGARIFLLKGGNLDEEMDEAGVNKNLIPLESLINIDFFAGKCLVDIKLN